MTVHTQRVEARHPRVAIPSPHILVWISLAIVLALVAVVVLVVTDVIAPGIQSNVPAIERLSDLRMTIGGGGFI
jgi:hypothetical protein